MSHFNNNVPKSLQDKILEVATFANENYIAEQQMECIMGDCELDEISGKSYSGFMPFQDGGYTARAYYPNDTDSSYHFTEDQSKDNIRRQQDCFSTFLLDEELDSETTYDMLTDEQAEKLCEYEREWFSDGALLTLEIWAEMPGGNRRSDTQYKTGDVFVRLSINYSDAPYYHSKYATDLYTKTYSATQFKKLSAEDIIKRIKY